MKRVLLALMSVCAAALILCGAGRARAADDWRLVMKNYAYELAHKGITFFETVDRAAKDGFKLMEVKPAQKIGGGIEGDMNLAKMDKATLDKVLAKCKEAGISIVGFGVGHPNNEAEVKTMFDNCKAAGVQWIVMEPKPEELDMLDKMAQEYNIAIAIHNHPEPSIYWNPETVLKAIQGRSKMIGACADTGHWKRSGLDPVQCLKELEGRIIMLHFKDVVPDEAGAAPPAKAAKGDKAGKGDRKGRKKTEQPAASGGVSLKMHDVAWGQGACNVPAMMAELKRQGFKGDFSIEYEYGATLDENIPKIIEYFNAHKDKSQAELEAEAPK